MNNSNSKKHRIVVRIEISTLTNHDGKLNKGKMDRLAMILSNLRNSGKDILVVTSGAIALGTEKLKLKMQPQTQIDMQATAAIGQAELIKFYQLYFDDYNQIVAQVLLTNDVMESENRVDNTKNTFDTLLEMNIIPIINENDAVSTSDIELDDNYPLALNVAQISHADTILIKLESDGKYIIVPKKNKKAILIENENELFSEIDKIEFYDNGNSKEDFPVSIESIEYKK